MDYGEWYVHFLNHPEHVQPQQVHKFMLQVLAEARYSLLYHYLLSFNLVTLMILPKCKGVS